MRSSRFRRRREQEGDATRQVRPPLEQTFNGNDHRRKAALHVRRAAAVDVLLVYDRFEGRPIPGIDVARWHHVSVSRENQRWSRWPAMGPEVVDVLGRHGLEGETERFKARADEPLAIRIVRRDRRLTDQLGGERDDRVLAVFNCSHVGPRSIRLRIGLSGTPNDLSRRCG